MSSADITVTIRAKDRTWEQMTPLYLQLLDWAVRRGEMSLSERTRHLAEWHALKPSEAAR